MDIFDKINAIIADNKVKAKKLAIALCFVFLFGVTEICVTGKLQKWNVELDDDDLNKKDQLEKP